MKIPKSCKIELAASTDAVRQVITEPYLDIQTIPGLDAADTKRVAQLVATDGRIMAMVPVEVSDHDVAGFVSGACLKAARKVAGKLEMSILSVNGTAEIPGGVTMPRGGAAQAYQDNTELGNHGYPNWRKVLPSGEKHTFKISLDVALLWRLTQAIGSEGPVVLSFNPEDTKDPVMVSQTGPGTPTGGKGVIMPIRMS